ncbi:hypothetical protein MTO96_051629 [Rhipicephalus appendiculatus]
MFSKETRKRPERERRDESGIGGGGAARESGASRVTFIPHRPSLRPLLQFPKSFFLFLPFTSVLSVSRARRSSALFPEFWSRLFAHSLAQLWLGASALTSTLDVVDVLRSVVASGLRGKLLSPSATTYRSS